MPCRSEARFTIRINMPQWASTDDFFLPQRGFGIQESGIERTMLFPISPCAPPSLVCASYFRNLMLCWPRCFYFKGTSVSNSKFDSSLMPDKLGCLCPLNQQPYKWVPIPPGSLVPDCCSIMKLLEAFLSQHCCVPELRKVEGNNQNHAIEAAKGDPESWGARPGALSSLEESQEAQVPTKCERNTEKAVLRVHKANPWDLRSMQRMGQWSCLVFFNLLTIFPLKWLGPGRITLWNPLKVAIMAWSLLFKYF